MGDSQGCVVGVDVCRAGWFAVVLLKGGTWRLEVFQDVERLWRSYSDAEILLIDVPIGLRDRGSTQRQCDMEARRLLGQPRASSVFPPPLRPSLDYATREEASACNFGLSGKRIGVQTWGIAPKIREIDQFLRANPDARRKAREVHPEVLFWSLNGMSAMAHNKKKRVGFEERLGVLRWHFEASDELADEALTTFRRKQVARDDILDALAAAVTSFLGCDRLAKIPKQPEVDAFGFPMEMVYLETH